MQADELLNLSQRLHWREPFLLANHGSQRDSAISQHLNRLMGPDSGLPTI